MANLEFSKANRTKVIKSFPTKEMGKEGDIVISHIASKGYFLCTKVGNTWYAANKLNELKRLRTPSLQDLKVDSLQVNNLRILKKPVNGEISLSKGDLTLDVEKDITLDAGGDITLDADGDITIDAGGTDIHFAAQGTSYLSWSAGGMLTMKALIDTNDYLSILVSNNGISQIITHDSSDSDLAYLSLRPEGDLKLAPQTGIMYLYDDDNVDDYAKFTVGTNGDLTLETVDANASAANLTLDVDGDIELNADGGDITFKDGATQKIGFDLSSGRYNFFYDLANFFRITVGSNGGTSLMTTDEDGTVGHLTFTPDGDLKLDPASQRTIIQATDTLYFDGGTHTNISETSDDTLTFVVGGTNLVEMVEAATNVVNINNSELTIDSGKKLYFDGSTLGNTYISEAAADTLRITIGGDIMVQLSEKGDDGNEVHFGSSCVGFTQLEPTYDAVATIVDFRHSNKQHLTFGSGNIGNLTFYFPLVSGNFQLLLKQDGTGSRTVTNYKVYAFDELIASGSASVKFAGGSNPTLTTDANHVDILSFYWDADNEIAYGVATLDFQF